MKLKYQIRSNVGRGEEVGSGLKRTTGDLRTPEVVNIIIGSSTETDVSLVLYETPPSTDLQLHRIPGNIQKQD